MLVKEKTEYLTLATWIGALVAVLGYVVLIPRYYGMGAAVATVISFIARWAASVYFSQRLFPVRYEWGPVLRLSAVSVGIVAVGTLLGPENVFVSFLFQSVLAAVYVAFVWWGGVLSRGQKAGILRLGGRVWATVREMRLVRALLPTPRGA